MSSFEAIFDKLQKGLKEDKFGSVHRAGDINISSTIPYGILTGIPRLDLCIGRPGLPAGKVIEFYGKPCVGKTTAALHVIAQAQRAGGGAFFIDAENSWDEPRAIELGVDTNKNFFIGNADSVEAIFRQLDIILKGRKEEGNFHEPCVVVVDSVTGKANEGELEKDIGAALRVGEDARVIRGCMRRVVSDIAKTKTVVIFVNHAISKIGAGPYQKKTDSSGGYAIKFYASLRCEFASSGQMMTGTKDDKRREGQKVTIKIEKLKNSRLEVPDVKDIELMGTHGIDLYHELLEAGCIAGMITRKNKLVYVYNDQEFHSGDWEGIVDNLGGQKEMYDNFIEWCLINNKMVGWGEKIYG